jgi:signal transduction histidine kinase/CheY-like chemotaxis protein
MTVEVRLEQDVVMARQRARQLAGMLGFDVGDQTRIATAVSEIARNAFRYAGGGRVDFSAEAGDTPTFHIRVVDRGPGFDHVGPVLDGTYQSTTGLGLGIAGAKRLMGEFQIESRAASGTTVEMSKPLPPKAPAPTAAHVNRVVEELTRAGPQSPLEELQQQNQDLLRTLHELRMHQDELAMTHSDLVRQEASLGRVNRELEDTNRGVVALYAELDEKAEFLRRASQMKSRFLSNMGHEFRTPLNAITGLSGLLLDRLDGDLSAEQEKQVRLIRGASEELTELVNDLLDLAKVEAGKVVIQANRFDAASLFAALRGMLRPLQAGNAAVALVFHDPDEPLWLETDERKLAQILRNFISNALKFTERGEVRVSATLKAGDLVEFRVADTGIGIAADDCERVFDDFTQVEGPRQKHVKGTGLGLPLVRQLAGLLGGRVDLSSELGVGSTFSATLPRVYRGPAEVSTSTTLLTEIDPTRRPVLLVEDNPEMLFLYERYLDGTAYQAVPVRTIAAARHALDRFRAAAIVLDVLLQEESTWDFMAELKRDESTRAIPVLVVTLVENEAKARSLGADIFHCKPIERGWLLEQLGRLAPADGGVPIEGKSALIVDDDEASRYMLKELLRETGLGDDLVEAGTGAEGLRLAWMGRPSVIFLDLDLPDLGGLHVLKALRAAVGTRHVPVIIRTSKVLDEAERLKLAGAGASAILSKQTRSLEAGRAEISDALRGVGLGDR